MTPTPTGQPPGALWYRPRHMGPKGPKPRRARRGPPSKPRYTGWRRIFHRRHLFKRFFRRKYWWLWLFIVAPLVLILGVMATLVVAYESITIPGPTHLEQ